MKKVSVLFLALMMSAGVQANGMDALSKVADAATKVLGNNSIDVNVAGGMVDGSVNATAKAETKSTAAAGGIVAAQRKGDTRVGVNAALGYAKGDIKAQAQAKDNSHAYAGGIVAGQH